MAQQQSNERPTIEADVEQLKHDLQQLAKRAGDRQQEAGSSAA